MGSACTRGGMPSGDEGAALKAATATPERAHRGPRRGSVALGWIRRLASWQTVVIVVGVFAVASAHAMTLGYVKLVNMDEAYAAALAERLLEGHRLYDGAVSQRGPLMYYTFELIAKLFGWDNIVAIRCVSLGLVLAHVGIAYWAARALLSRRAAIVVFAILVYCFAFGFDAYDGLALHGESIVAPLAVAAAALGALAMRDGPGARGRALKLVLAGLLFGAAACVKQTAIVQPLPLLLWWFLGIRGSAVKRSTWAREALIVGASLVFVPLVFAVHAWAQGTLRQLVYYCFSYNVSVHVQPGRQATHILKYVTENALKSPLFFLANAVSIALVVRRWWARLARTVASGARSELTRGFDLVDYLGLEFLVAFAIAASLPQMFQHYYIIVVPYLALSLAASTAASMRGARRSGLLRSGLLACAVLWAFMGAQTAYLREKTDGRVLHGLALEKVASYVQKVTRPDDRIFVWGFSPWLYLYAHRRPAGRYVFATYTTGFVAWFWDELDIEPARVVPGSVKALLEDLDREKPAVVVDAGSVEIARPMRAYAWAAEWLHAHYCFDARIGAFDVYRRKADGAACATDHFPYAALPVDWADAPLRVPMPMSVDHVESRPLPPGDFLKPLRFDFTRDVCRDWGKLWWEGLPDKRTCNYGVLFDEDDPHRGIRDDPDDDRVCDPSRVDAPEEPR